MNSKFYFKAIMIISPILIACGWDWDTFQMERKAFPSVHEAIVGKFYRHSPELYEWRVRNRTKLIRQFPDSLSLYDDLSMAYDKTGRSREAIDVMLKKNNIAPAKYETYSNLGLFYMHFGDIDSGVYYIRKALKINPNAHFGREKYQLHLGEYILDKTKNKPLVLPLGQENNNFYHYLNERVFQPAIDKGSNRKDEVSKAIKGVTGMMHFANYRSPVLLEVLGDLLAFSYEQRGAGHLASRAYLKASFETSDPKAKKDYENKASKVRAQVYGHEFAIDEFYRRDNLKTGEGPLYSMQNLTFALKLEVQSAGFWFDSIRANEILWIKQGLNPDSMFALTYYDPMPEQKKYYDNYYSKAKTDAKYIDETWWLTTQFADSNFIRGIHGHSLMPDSISQWLDSFYLIDLAPAKEIIESKPKNVKLSDHDKSNFKWKLGLALSLVSVVISGFVLMNNRRRNKN